MTRSFFFATALALPALLALGCNGDASTSISIASVGVSVGVGVGGAETSAGVGGAGGLGGLGGLGGAGGASTSSGPSGPCPPDMALAASFCIDCWEAPNQPGEKPLVMESAVLAEQWCKEQGKRLCTEDEWDTACEGPNQSTYPYGDTHVDGRCNDDKTWRVVDEGALNTWPSPAAQNELDKLWQGAPNGTDTECVSGYGVYDLTGNVEEWVIRTKPHANSYPHVLKGCYWAGCYGGGKPTCQSTNPNHADGFMYYETGFRCCANLTGP